MVVDDGARSQMLYVLLENMFPPSRKRLPANDAVDIYYDDYGLHRRVDYPTIRNAYILFKVCLDQLPIA